MVKKRKPYNTYTKECKLEALRLMETTDRSASEITMGLGISRNQLYKWKEPLEQIIRAREQLFLILENITLRFFLMGDPFNFLWKFWGHNT